MRICIVNDSFGRLVDGVRFLGPHRRILSIAKCLKEQDFDVVLCCPFFQVDYEDYESNPIFVERPKRYLRWQYLNSFVLLRQLRKVGKVDIVLVHLPDPVTKSLTILKTPIHDPLCFLDIADLWYSPSIGYLHKRMSNKLMELAAKRAGKITVHHETVGNRISQLTDPSKVKIIPNGVDTDLFSPSIKPAQLPNIEDRHILVYSGTVSEYTGCDRIPLIAKEVVRKRRDVLFLITGAGPHLKEMKKEVKQRGLVDFFMFQDFISQDELPSILAIADIGIAPFPVREDTHTVMPLKVLEYMAMGKPTIVSPIVGARSLVDHGQTGLVTLIEEFADSILLLIGDASLRESMGKEARKKVKKRYSWKSLVREMLSFWFS